MDTLFSFPFQNHLSLDRLADYWRRSAETSGPNQAWARQVAERLDAAPELAGVIDELPVVDQHRELVDAMMAAVFPPSTTEDVIGAANQPFSMHPIYQTDGYRQLHIPEYNLPSLLCMTSEELTHAKTMQAYFWILQEYYGVDLDIQLQYPMVVSLDDPDTGLQRYYRFFYNPRFMSIEPTDQVPDLAPEEIDRLLENLTDLELWLQTIPPESFTFRGFSIVTVLDVTEQHALSLLKDDLLQKHAMTTEEHVLRLQQHLRNLIHRQNLDLGFLCLMGGDLDDPGTIHPIGRSLLLHDGEMPACPERGNSVYARSITSELPIIIQDLQATDAVSGIEAKLTEKNYRSLLVAPLRVRDRIIGLLELASPDPGDLHSYNVRFLNEVITLFATAMQRLLEEREDRVQAFIKEEYTALHPVVEWRFREAALHRLEQDESVRPTNDQESITFPNVYPLYGLADIRGSSTHRDAAIQADLVEQLGLAHMVVVEAASIRPLPILDEVAHRVGEYVASIRENLTTGDEVNALHFLREDVETLFDHLSTFGPEVRRRIAGYQNALDPTLQVIYRQRKDFEDSVTMINDAVGQFIDAQEDEAQRMFPHYFEKFKTDGIDYNIFVGASLLKNSDRFDSLYLRNLRLWQLLMGCGIAWRTAALQPELPVKLDVAQLILVQNVPLSIRFRMDEKRFDVDGAYNIRYEIIKKRIDKALIQGTDERLTQPGHIAIVYSQPGEAAEYRRYIEYLQASGYLADTVEDLVLEDLQGAHGLRALRVRVSDTEPADPFELDASGALANLGQGGVALTDTAEPLLASAER